MISIVEEIKTIIPNQPDAGSLQAFLARVHELAQDSELETDIGSIKELNDMLSDLYTKNTNLFRSNPNLEVDIKGIMLKLAWFNPFILDSKQKKELIAKNLTYAIKQGWSPLDSIRKLLEYYEIDGTPDELRRSDLMKLLSDNSERIGQEMIHLKSGEEVGSTVKNWIKDYISYSDQKTTEADSYTLAQYLYNNQNVKKLNSSDKDILAQVLKIYNFIKQSNSTSKPKSFAPDMSGEVSMKKQPPPMAPKQTQVKPPQPKSEFDQKLAQISASGHGQDLTALKKQIESNKVSLAPKSPAPATGVKMTPEEIKRETITPELPSHQTPVIPKPAPPPAPKPMVPKPAYIPEPKPIHIVEPAKPREELRRPPGKMSLQTLDSIKVVDDLKKVEVGHLRQAQINSQIEMIKTKIITLSRANRIIPYYAVLAFEQSPLFKTYLQIGGKIILNEEVDRSGAFRKAVSEVGTDMSLAEFEAIADLRKEIERL